MHKDHCVISWFVFIITCNFFSRFLIHQCNKNIVSGRCHALLLSHSLSLSSLSNKFHCPIIFVHFRTVANCNYSLISDSFALHKPQCIHVVVVFSFFSTLCNELQLHPLWKIYFMHHAFETLFFRVFIYKLICVFTGVFMNFVCTKIYRKVKADQTDMKKKELKVRVTCCY